MGLTICTEMISRLSTSPEGSSRVEDGTAPEKLLLGSFLGPRKDIYAVRSMHGLPPHCMDLHHNHGECNKVPGITIHWALRWTIKSLIF